MDKSREKSFINIIIMAKKTMASELKHRDVSKLTMITYALARGYKIDDDWLDGLIDGFDNEIAKEVARVICGREPLNDEILPIIKPIVDHFRNWAKGISEEKHYIS